MIIITPILFVFGTLYIDDSARGGLISLLAPLAAALAFSAFVSRVARRRWLRLCEVYYKFE